MVVPGPGGNLKGEKPKLDNARQLRGIFLSKPNGEKFKLTMKAVRRKLGKDCSGKRMGRKSETGKKSSKKQGLEAENSCCVIDGSLSFQEFGAGTSLSTVKRQGRTPR